MRYVIDFTLYLFKVNEQHVIQTFKITYEGTAQADTVLYSNSYAMINPNQT